MADAIERYWQALGKKDATAMASCYSRDAQFVDPVFRLQGEEIGHMWMQLFGDAKDLEIETEPLVRHGDHAHGVWHATYTFTPTGRRVDNTIYTTIVADENAIQEHEDHFEFWRWSRMALGLPGTLLGWTPYLRNKVRTMASKRLAASR